MSRWLGVPRWWHDIGVCINYLLEWGWPPTVMMPKALWLIYVLPTKTLQLRAPWKSPEQLMFVLHWVDQTRSKPACDNRISVGVSMEKQDVSLEFILLWETKTRFWLNFTHWQGVWRRGAILGEKTPAMSWEQLYIIFAIKEKEGAEVSIFFCK